MKRLTFANPKNDVAFKKIFGNEDKTEILISFLNAVLDFTGDREIVEIQILDPYQAPKLAVLKSTTLDIRARDRRGVTFIVEMQVENMEGIIKRFLYYVTKAYSSQIEKGEDYPKLNQVIFIGILDFKMFAGDDYLTAHLLLNKKTYRQEIKDLELYFIELPKFKKKLTDLSTVLEKWLYFIKHAAELEVIPENADFEEIQEAYQIANKFNWSPDEWDIYDYWATRLRDEARIKEQRHKAGLEEGRQEGFEEGRQEGRQEGIEQGIEQGKIQEKLDTARKMLADGLDPSVVAKYTGLPSDELANYLDKT